MGREKRIKLKNIDSHTLCTEDNIFKILNILIHNIFLIFQQAYCHRDWKKCKALLFNLFLQYFFCNLFIFKKKQRQIQIQKYMTCIYNLHRRNTCNLSKQTFCNIKLKFQTPRTISNVFVILMMIYSQ